MKQVYLDNASTTALRPEVISVITEVLTAEYGNPSSTHSFGRNSKAVIETARKSIAKQINCNAQEIVFTSSGTEANNWIINNAVKTLNVKRIISTKIEHHAVLYPILKIQQDTNIEVVFLNILENGTIDYKQLEELLSKNIPTLVSLMHVNNETGVVLDINKVSSLCSISNIFLHSDTVQSMGKISFNLQELNIDFIVASAHKFHGPKGVGFVYIKKNTQIGSFILGGEQEKGLRAGTEAVHQIAGLAKALEISYACLELEKKQISELKKYCLDSLKKAFPETIIIAEQNASYNITNVILPLSNQQASMLLFALDLKGIAVSRGSACQSGSSKPSHVLSEFLSESNLKKPSIRISFSHYNTKEDIDSLVNALIEL